MVKKVLFLWMLAVSLCSVKAGDVYVKVTSPEQLVVGAEYILAAQTESEAYVAEAFTSNYLSTITTGFVVNGHSIVMTTEAPLVFVLGGTANGYTLGYDNKYLEYANLNSNPTDLKESSSTESDEVKWICSFDTGKIMNVAKSERFLGLNSNTGRIKAMNNDGNLTVSLYVNSSFITLSSACTDGNKYYGTFSSGSAFVVPGDLTVSEIQVEDDKLVVRDYNTGDVVPANRGVMVSSTEPGEHAVVLSDQEGEALLDDENCLYPSGDKDITADEMAEAHPGCVYYRLTMHEGKTLGFYWGADGGGTFNLGANKAYLAIPNEQASRISGFNLVDNETASIRVLPAERTDDTMYNLHGQRVSDNAKGIVIKNGKKQIKR